MKQAYNFVKVKLNNITYLESDRIYLTIYTVSDKLIVRSTIQNYLDLLCSKNFVRVHRSFAINLLHLDAILQKEVTVNGKLLPVGKVYRDELLFVLRLG